MSLHKLDSAYRSGMVCCGLRARNRAFLRRGPGRLYVGIRCLDNTCIHPLDAAA